MDKTKLPRHWQAYKKAIDIWWEENKEKLKTGELSNARLCLAFNYACAEALDMSEDTLKSNAWTLMDGIRPYKHLRWHEIYARIDDRDIGIPIEHFLAQVTENLLK